LKPGLIPGFFVVERYVQISAYEFKWNSRGKVKIPSSFIEKCHTIGTVIVQDNFRDFVRCDFTHMIE